MTKDVQELMIDFKEEIRNLKTRMLCDIDEAGLPPITVNEIQTCVANLELARLACERALLWHRHALSNS